MTRERVVTFRFYEELNDFLPESVRKRTFPYRFNGRPSVKDAIEAIGVPHPEVDLILVNGRSVGFGYHLEGGERVAVYPMFESLDIRPLVRLRASPLRVTRFVVDVHLGRLARRLRLLGFDVVYRQPFEDEHIVAISVRERRLILTRDRELLKHGDVTHGYWVRSTDPNLQVAEVVRRLDIAAVIDPFSRCMDCNGTIEQMDAATARLQVPARSAEAFDIFFRCVECNKVYWRGSHYERMRAWVDRFRLSLTDRGSRDGVDGGGADDEVI